MLEQGIKKSCKFQLILSSCFVLSVALQTSRKGPILHSRPTTLSCVRGGGETSNYVKKNLTACAKVRLITGFGSKIKVRGRKLRDTMSIV